MKGKLLFVAGLATGYVVGTRAGRSAYTALTEGLRTARESAPVQAAVGKVKDLAQERMPALAGAVSGVASTTAGVASAASDAGQAPESAEEAAAVFEEQLPEAGGAIDDAASSAATEPGDADESASPTATS